MHSTRNLLHKTPEMHIVLHGGGAYSAPKGRDFPTHQHPTWELVYYREGHIRGMVGEETYTSHPGMLLLTPPRTLHAEIAVTAYTNYHISIEGDAPDAWPRTCVDDAYHTLGHLCGAIVREWVGQSPERESMIDLLLGQLDIHLRRDQEARQLSESERVVREAECLMQERFAASVIIDAVAREVGVSPSSLRAHFAILRGCTPTAYLRYLRVQHALAMLRESTLTLDAIAPLCGCYSASHLSRCVKQETGRSPGSFRIPRD